MLAVHAISLLPSTFHAELIIWVERCSPDEESRAAGTVMFSLIAVAPVPSTGTGTVIIACGKREWVNG